MIVPILNKALPLDPNLFPFSTIWKTTDGDKMMYLSMSPEHGIKRLLSEGIGNCFSISKSFRNIKRAGSLHLSEFLMLEWYRENAVYTDIMSDVEKLFYQFGFKKNWQVFSMNYPAAKQSGYLKDVIPAEAGIQTKYSFNYF